MMRFAVPATKGMSTLAAITMGGSIHSLLQDLAQLQKENISLRASLVECTNKLNEATMIIESNRAPMFSRN